MTIIQNLLTVQTPETSNTTETGQELFEYNRTEITQIQNIPTTSQPSGTILSATNSSSGYLYSAIVPSGTYRGLTYTPLPFPVYFNGTSYQYITITADSYIVFITDPILYNHNSTPDFSIGEPKYDKIYINANTFNALYTSADAGPYGFSGSTQLITGTTPNRVYKFTYVGYFSNKGNPLIWSISFYENNPYIIDIHTNTIYTGNFYNGFYDKNGKLFKSFPTYSNKGYRITTTFNNGTHTWTCPENVYEVSIVCVGGGGGPAGGYGFGASGAGGGGLGWKNKQIVIPGNTYTIQVGKGGERTLSANRAGAGGTSYFNNSNIVAGGGGFGAQVAVDIPGIGGTYFGEGGGNGGSGGNRGSNNNIAGGGGGAGGYSGNGGNGGSNFTFSTVDANPQPGLSGSGGGGGGGGAGGGADTGGSGGGVGLYGEGNSGSGGAAGGGDGSGGFGGSDGENASFAFLNNLTRNHFDPTSDIKFSVPGRYGGGGAGTDNGTNIEYENGSHGAVRLIWGPRLIRKFPKRNTGDLYFTYRYIKWQIAESRNSSSTQVSEFKLFFNQSEIIYPNSTTVSSSTGSDPQNLIDFLTTTKFTSSSLNVDIIFDLIDQTNITGYKWVTADNDDTQDPKSWIVYGSNDNSNWTEIDRVSNYTAPSNRQESSRMFYLPIIPR